MEQLYSTQFRTCHQNSEETLPQFSTEVFVYPTQADNILASVAVDVLTDGLSDPELQQNLKLLRSNTLGDSRKMIAVSSSQTDSLEKPRSS